MKKTNGFWTTTRRATVVFCAAGLVASASTGCSGGGADTATTGGSTTSASSASSGGAGGSNPCGPGTTLCGDTCTVTDFDPANCGACGTACKDGEVCSKGSCGVTCSGGATKCGDKCADTQGDTANCGGCGMACKAGEVCAKGMCALDCVGGTTKCGDKCVDTAADTSNCGGCGMVCKAGELCASGACSLTCLGNTSICSGVCVDTSNDPANCGACAMACPAGEVCSAGACAALCGGGSLECSGKCIDPMLDPQNCGSCGNVCPAGQVCSQGACGLVCAGGTTACNGKCVDTNTDVANCGGCAMACGADKVCSGGVCASICGGSLTKCGNACVDTMVDNANCGACGNACPAGATCTAGSCVQCDSNVTDCDGDGWLLADGDCCDKPGACGSEPAKVNPGAIEVVGNGVDDNCNGLTDLFDQADTQPCDSGLASNSATPGDYAKALGICRTTTANPAAKKDRTWGLISASLQRANGVALDDARAVSIRSGYGSSIVPTNGQKLVVMSSGIAADATQTTPGPNGGAPNGSNVSTSQNGANKAADIANCNNATCIKDWFTTANAPLKNANELPVAPNCGAGNAGSPATANDSAMLVLTLRAPTNAKAFSFNTYFISAEYPEYVCTNFNDQLIALVDTPNGTPSPIANPIDKNLMTYSSGGQKWPIGINIANATSLFATCDAAQLMNAACSGSKVGAGSCSLGASGLAGTGFEKPSGSSCNVGGGTYWLSTAGNVIPGDTVQIRIAVWDVGDSSFDSVALVDGFTWLANATLPGTN